MKSSRIVKAGIAIAAVLFVLAFAGCPQDSTSNSQALVSGITVAGITLDSVPSPITEADWYNYETSLESLGPAFTKIVYFQDRAVLDNAAINVTASSGAAVAYGTEFGSQRPDEFPYKANDRISLSHNEYLYIRVTSEDGKTINHYRLNIQVLSDSTLLQTVTVGGVTAGYGTSASAWDQVEAPGVLSLSNTEKANAQIVAVPFNSGATIKYAKVTGGGEPGFSYADTFSFEDDDIIYIEVTAQNTVNVSYYKIVVEIGRDATLRSLAVGSTEQDSVTYLGRPSSTWDVPSADIGRYQTDPQPIDGPGLEIVAVPNDGEAEVYWAVRNETAAPSGEPDFQAITATAPVYKFSGNVNDYLYIKVISANTAVTNYYRMRVIIPMEGKILYGTPKLDDPDGLLAHYIDPIWNDPAMDDLIFDISRVNQAETIAAWFRETWGQHTTATAKALWDDDGIWVFADIDFKDYQTSATGSVIQRKAGVGSTGGDHEQDSLEIFINERLQDMLSAPSSERDFGNQFRVDANNVLSGQAAGINPPGGSNAPVTVFQNSGKTRAWLKDNNQGYYVIAQAPFTFKSAATNVFNTDGTVKDGARIGFELQINACSVSGTRDGILTWNGVNSQAYQNARGYGEVTLELAGRERVTDAQTPQISSDPAGEIYLLADTIAPLSVTASVGDGGALSYQWYSAASSTAAGTPLTGSTGTTYQPVITEEGTYYYYVVVTNTNDTVNGETTAETKSAVAAITVFDAAEIVEKISLENGASAVYRFALPSGETWGSYSKITVDYKVDADNLTKGILRVRLYGNYKASDFSVLGTSRIANLNNYNAPWIMEDTNDRNNWSTLGAAADTWFTVEYDISGGLRANSGFSQDNNPKAADTGPFYFGIGISGNAATATDPSNTITQLVKNVTLSNADGTKKVVSYGSGFAEPTFISYSPVYSTRVYENE